MAQDLAFSIKILGKDGELSKLAEIEKGLIKVREQRKYLNDAYKAGEISQTQLAKSTAELNLTTKALGKEKRDITRTVELETQRAQNQAGTYKSLDATLQILKRDYKALTLEERNSAKGQELLKKIQTTDKTLKQFDSSIGQNQRNVGNYSGALEGLNGVFSGFGLQIGRQIQQLAQVRAGIAKMVTALTAQKTATIATSEAQGVHAASTAAATTAQAAQTSATYAALPALARLKIALLSSGIGVVLVALGAFVGLAVAATKRSIEFAKELSGLKAVLGDLGTNTAMKELSREAQALGASTAYTATQAVQMETEFAKLGFGVSAILYATKSTLDLAASLKTDLASAAQLTGSALNIFGLDASEAQRVNDVLALSASKSALDFEGLTGAIKLAAPAASATGRTIEEMAGLLGVLANNGLKGSIAGTGLKRVFIRLNAQGITLNEALNKVANSSDQLTTSVQLVGEEGAIALLGLAKGADSIDGLTESFYNAEGAAKAMAETMLDNLAGDTTKAKSAWEGLLLSVEDGEGVFTSVSRAVVQGWTGVLGIFRAVSIGVGRFFSLLKLDVNQKLVFLKSSLTILGQYISIFANNAKLIIADVPLLGSAIDKGKAEKNIREAVSIIKKANDESILAHKAYDDKKAEFDKVSIQNQIKQNDHKRKLEEEAVKAEQELAEETEKERKKREAEARRLREQAIKDVENNNKLILKLARELRDSETSIAQDGRDKEVDILDNKLSDKIAALEAEKTSNKELSKLSKQQADQRKQINVLVDAQIEQLLIEHRQTLSTIDQKYDAESLSDLKKVNDLKLTELDSFYQLEELKIRNKVVNDLITEEQAQAQLLAIRKKYLEDKLALIDQETTEGKIKAQELVNEIDALTQDDTGKSVVAKLLSITDEEAELLKQKAFSLANEIADTIANIQQTKRDKEVRDEAKSNEDKKNDAITTYNQQLKDGVITQEEYNALKSDLDIEYDQLKENLERKAFERNKKAAIAQAAVNGSLAILNVLATNKGGLISRAIEVAFVALQTGLQIAAINAQEFATGGLVLSGQRVPSNAKNISTKANGDNVLATVRAGEVVLNEQQQNALGGARTFAAIGVPGFVNGGLIPPSYFTPFAPPQITPSGGVVSVSGGLNELQFNQLLDSVNSRIETRLTNIRVSAPNISKTQDDISTIESNAKY